MKKLHKTLTLALALIMILGIMAVPASAASSREYVIFTEEEFWDLSVPRPAEGSYLFILVKDTFDPFGKHPDLTIEEYVKHMGGATDKVSSDTYSHRLNSYAGVKEAAMKAYERIDDPEYKAIIVDTFDLDIKPNDTPQPETTTKPEAPVTTPVPTTKPETTTTATVTGFSDVKPGDWYYEAVTEFAKSGLLAGYSDGTFRPNNYVTGGELATILCRIYGIDDAGLQRTKDYMIANPNMLWLTWTDGKVTVDHWAMPAMFAAYDTTGDVFKPSMTNYEFNRGNTAQALVSMASSSTWLIGTKPSYDNSEEAIKSTVAGIPDVTYNELNVDERTYGYGGNDPLGRDKWNSGAIALAYQMGIMHGVDSTGRCDPWGKVTRAQLVQMLYNMGIKQAGQLTPRSQLEDIAAANAAQIASGVIIGGVSGGSGSK